MKKALHVSPKTFDRYGDILIDLHNASGRVSDIFVYLQRANQELPSADYLDVSEVGDQLNSALIHLEKAKAELQKFVDL